MEVPLSRIAQIVNGSVIGDGSVTVSGVNSLDAAVTGEISFYANRRYADRLKVTKATAVIVAENNSCYNGAQIVTSNPELAFARVAGLFAPPLARHSGISELATICKTCMLGKNVSIYPGVYVGEGSFVGDGVTLFPGTFVGERVKIGNNTVIYPNVTIHRDCIIGNDVIINAGSVVGSDGFGYARDGAVSVRIPQLGTVRIDDNVEIGANNCIDRAALNVTWIKRGVKTDNFVHIGHNSIVGENTIIVAQTAIGGSVTIGNGVVIGGHVAISDNLEIGDRVMIGSKSGVARSIPAGEIVSGIPTMPHLMWLKISQLLLKLPQFYDRIKKLEKKMERLD